jgi:cell division protein FtsW
MTERQAGYDDIILLIGALLLVGTGIIMVYSSSSVLAVKRFGDSYYFLKRQALFAVLGGMALVTCRYVPYVLYRKLVYPILFLGMALLVALHIPGWAREIGGAKRWLGFMGWSFQPSEFAKLALVIYLAYSMTKKQEDIKRFCIGFLPHVLVLGCYVILILTQPDFGTASIIAMIAWIMLFIGGVRVSYLLGTMATLLPVAYFLLIDAGYRVRRLVAFLDPWEHKDGAGYQIIHSLMAFGSGGLAGQGLGNSHQKLFYLPEPHTDFIFSVIGEELGLIGVCGIIIIYTVVLYAGFRLALDCSDRFATYLAAGITSVLGVQVMVNIGVVMGLLPTKGLTLPLISYGGSSVVVTMASIGILMNISGTQRTGRKGK